MKKPLILLLILVTLLVAQTVHAGGKAATCEIFTQRQLRYKGTCRFYPETGGSFSISHTVQGTPLLDGVTDISVTIVAKGLAEVRGLTLNGNNSRWGEARRSSKDKACWEGSDFTICAR